MFRSVDHDDDGIDEKNDCDDYNPEIGDKQEHEDSDGDGFGAPDVSRTAEGCQLSPGWVENDDDCDDEDSTKSTETAWFWDGDDDGHGAGESEVLCASDLRYSLVGDDCDDTEASVYPDAPKIVGDGLDNDCDGLGDDPAPEGELSTSDADSSFTGSDEMMLGSSLLGVPDWNGDGVPEIAMGAPGLGGDDPTGGVVVALSPFNSDLVLDGTVDGGEQVVIYRGEEAGDGAGAVLGGTDLDDDGYSDLIVGVPGVGDSSISPGGGGVFALGPGTGPGTDTLGSGPKGYAYVVLGPVQPGEYTLGDFRSVTLKGPAAGGQLGAALSPAGDVDLDGDGELLLGAPYTDVDDASEAGAVYLVQGPVRGSGTVSSDLEAVTITGTAAYDRLGMAVVGGLDLNGDGVGAMVLGAPTNGEDVRSTSETKTGCAYVVYDIGTAGGSVSDLAWTQLCGAESEGFASRLAAAGDVDGDGAPDLLVGAIHADTDSLTDAGAIYLYAGAELRDTSAGTAVTAGPIATIYGIATKDYLSSTMTSPGDIDLDGYAEILFGIPNAVEQRGTAHLYFGPASGTLDPDGADLIIMGSVKLRAGFSVASPGDVNSLGGNDLLIGGVEYDDSPSQPGGAYLFLTDGL